MPNPFSNPNANSNSNGVIRVTDTGTGGSRVVYDVHKCSIKKVTVETKWKASGEEVDSKLEKTMVDGVKTIKQVDITTSVIAYDKNQTNKEPKTIYLISSPKGKSVTIKVEREDGKCIKPGHKQYDVTYPGCTDDEGSGPEIVAYDTVNTVTKQLTVPTYYPANNFQVIPYDVKEKVKNESTVNIKAFKIKDVSEALSYWKLPIPINKEFVTIFHHYTCKGNFNYKIISYPDIQYNITFSVGTEDKEIDNSPEFKTWIYPVFSAAVSYNGGNDKLELKSEFGLSKTEEVIDVETTRKSIELDKNKEIIHITHKHDSITDEVGFNLFQGNSSIDRILDLCNILDKIFNADFLEEFKSFDSSDLVDDYKVCELKLYPPKVFISLECKYHTSKDLKIGKYFDIYVACNPIVSAEYKIDLLYLLVSSITAGAGTGLYVMLKNLDKVVEVLLGNEYKKKYKDVKPIEFDIYINLIIKGAANGNFHWIIDTTQNQDHNSTAGAIEGVLSVDLETGVKARLDTFIIAVGCEASASGSSGIKLKFEFQDHIKQGEGLILLPETIFLGLTVKYCVKGELGLLEIWHFGESLEDEKTLLDQMKIEWLSDKIVFFKENAEKHIGSGRSF